ncbi:MAG: imidazole glycerol phosphate synthase subunit HisH [bacterium]|nr:imidazole glycerol phosphate synthase subunit HisH [bacterium]
MVVVDYGMGNLRSAQKGLEKAGVRAVVSGDPGVVASADGVVLPGVGAFKDCMDNLRSSGLVKPVLDAIAADRPFLGICLGMQLMLSVSEEFGMHEGLGVVPGRVVRFPSGQGRKVPHMGWNRLHLAGQSPLFQGVPEGSFFYFVHSYYAVPEDDSVVGGWTDYGVRFCSAISRGRLFATQFHPEKSHRHGLKILENFSRIVADYKEG